MSDTDQMLRAIINGQSDLKQELLKKIEEVDVTLEGVEERLSKPIPTPPAPEEYYQENLAESGLEILLYQHRLLQELWS